MKTDKEVLELFRAKYLETVCSEAGPFDDNQLRKNPDGGWQQRFGDSATITLGPEDEEPHEVHGGIHKRWVEEGRENGWLGYPTSDEEGYPGDGNPDTDRISHFEHGDIVWNADKPTVTRIENIKALHGRTTPGHAKAGKSTKESVERQQRLKPTAPAALELPEDVRTMLGSIDSELEAIDKIIQAEFSPNPGTSEQDAPGATVRRALAKLRSQRRAFDSKAFFIVTFGMVKAGKSTLVNTFVGKLVSPMGSSKETTLRCSIVMAADEGHPEGIYLYSPRHPTDLREGQDLESLRRWSAGNGRLLIEHLSGLISDEEFGREIELTARLDFSVEELEHILTTDPLPKYPNILPPVIRIDVERLGDDNVSMDLLREGVAILDTPGLDGARTNAEKDPFWDVLPVCGDYFLLVQSSMSAINKDCLELVRDIYAKTKSVPILAVFNEFAANFWLLPEEQKKKLREDSETAAMELARHLRTEVGGKIPEQIAINAGEAASALPQLGTPEVAKSPAELLEESRILILRKSILETIKNKRIKIKVANSVDRLTKTLREEQVNLEKLADDLLKDGAERKADRESKWTEARKASDDLANAFLGEGDGVRIAQKVGLRFSDCLKEAFPKECIKNGDYQEHRGAANQQDDNQTCLNRDTVRTQLRKWGEDIASAYGDLVQKQFSNHDLHRTIGVWKSLFESMESLLAELKNWKDKIFGPDGFLPDEETVKDRRFPDLLFEEFMEEKFIKEFIPDSGDLEIPPAPRFYHFWPVRRPYGKKTVWECDCARVVKKLRNALEKHYLQQAPETAKKRLEEAILKKGQNYAHDLQNRLGVALKTAREEEDQWQSALKKRIDAIRSIVGNLTTIERILERN